MSSLLTAQLFPVADLSLERGCLIALGSRSLLDLWFRDSTDLNRNLTVAASAPVSERSVKLRKLSDS